VFAASFNSNDSEFCLHSISAICEKSVGLRLAVAQDVINEVKRQKCELQIYAYHDGDLSLDGSEHRPTD
jgi:hypothetical protein